MLNGKLTHRRTINSKYGTSDIDWLRQKIDSSAERFQGKPKFKYLLPLDEKVTERIQTETSLRQTSSLERPGKHRARRSSDKPRRIESKENSVH